MHPRSPVLRFLEPWNILRLYFIGAQMCSERSVWQCPLKKNPGLEMELFSRRLALSGPAPCAPQVWRPFSRECAWRVPNHLGTRSFMCNGLLQSHGALEALDVSRLSVETSGVFGKDSWSTCGLVYESRLNIFQLRWFDSWNWVTGSRYNKNRKKAWVYYHLDLRKWKSSFSIALAKYASVLLTISIVCLLLWNHPGFYRNSISWCWAHTIWQHFCRHSAKR